MGITASGNVEFRWLFKYLPAQRFYHPLGVPGMFSCSLAPLPREISAPGVGIRQHISNGAALACTSSQDPTGPPKSHPQTQACSDPGMWHQVGSLPLNKFSNNSPSPLFFFYFIFIMEYSSFAMFCSFLVNCYLILLCRDIYIFFFGLLPILHILFRVLQGVEFFVLYSTSLLITYFLYVRVCIIIWTS